MRKLIMTTFITAMLASPMALAQDRQLDPIFQYTPVSGQPDASCFDAAADNRNVIVRGLTSTAGQTIIGGLLGAALGNQIGGGSGKDIATGVGTALGASAGAYNAQRQRDARIRECQQYQGYANNYANQQGYSASTGATTGRVIRSTANSGAAYTTSYAPANTSYNGPSDYERFGLGR